MILEKLNSPRRPTSSATWPSVVTPDQVTAQQATQAGGPYASLGLTDDSVQTAFAFQSRPFFRPFFALHDRSTSAM